VIAVVWQETFARAFGVAVPVVERVGLAGVVWAIYAADRILDGLQPDPAAQATDRVLAVAAGLAALAMIPGWPLPAAGLAVGAAGLLLTGATPPPSGPTRSCSRR
jgi:hypothetical protein